MKLIVIGSGIAGMYAAWLLQRKGHEVIVCEANDYVGGHTQTHVITHGGRDWNIDTGFIVFNDWTYPNFIKLLKTLNIPSQPTSMSFSVHDDESGLEYNGTSLNTLFAQRRNLLRPAFWHMVMDIVRFNREAPKLLSGDDHSTTISEYALANGYSREFLEYYLLPMGGAVWSATPGRMREFPARYLVQFFKNHGFLNVNDRPQWRVIQGGSQSYARVLSAPLRATTRCNAPVRSISRSDGATVTLTSGEVLRAQGCVLALHGDDALRLLEDPSEAEQQVLGAFTFQENSAVLHTDQRFLPQRNLARAAWNYRIPSQGHEACSVTYDMNVLQGLDSQEHFLVSLNQEGIATECVLRSVTYRHPIYTVRSVAAQRRHAEVSGQRSTWYCGAYWGYGFHEDGVNSALAVARQFGIEVP